MKTLPAWVTQAVTDEIKASFTTEEITNLDFGTFWETVDAQNAFESEWEEWKEKGIKTIYRKIFKEYHANHRKN